MHLYKMVIFSIGKIIFYQLFGNINIEEEKSQLFQV